MRKNFTMLRVIVSILFVGSVQSILSPAVLDSLYNFFSGFPDDLVNDQTSMSKEYDFVIIGAGSAGSVLTNRLTENEEWNVLLLEEGKDEIFLTDIPLLAATLHITDYVRLYRSEPSPWKEDGTGGYCLSMTDGRCNLPYGKAVGGSSVVNFMIYSRGSPSDYDGWAAQGNPGWSYLDVLPYFLKSENCKLLDQDFRFHGHRGYLDVTTVPYVSRLRERFLQAGEELGYDTIDYNGNKLIGFSPTQVHLRYGRRVSANKAFLRPIRDRSNFHLSKFSKVTRIVIDPKTKTAVGVEFIKNDKKHFVSVRKEVILSAGTLNSPQVLMLSGIGPKEHLASLGIEVIEDLPVGFNLQDHVSMSALTFLVNESVTLVEPRLVLNLENTLDYFVKGAGSLTVPGGAECLAFVNTKRTMSKETKNKAFVKDNVKSEVPSSPNVTTIRLNPQYFKSILFSNLSRIMEEDIPDVELVLGISGFPGDISGSYRRLLALSDDFYKEIFTGYEGYDSFTIVPIILQPKSRGRITLKSSDPFQWPVFELNYYDHQDDLDTMVRGIKKAIEVGSTKAFKRFNATLIPLRLSGCQNFTFESDSYWSCIARHVSTTLGHYVGTCKMGTRENSGVVDHRLRVHGIKGLRVVDASVIPTIIAGHTNAPTYMIAEKAGDMIKEDWKKFDFQLKEDTT